MLRLTRHTVYSCVRMGPSGIVLKGFPRPTLCSSTIVLFPVLFDLVARRDRLWGIFMDTPFSSNEWQQWQLGGLPVYHQRCVSSAVWVACAEAAAVCSGQCARNLSTHGRRGHGRDEYFRPLHRQNYR